MTSPEEKTEKIKKIPSPGVKQIGHFEIIRQIGQGAMGLVYEASQAGLDRKVALKILPSHYAQDRTFVKRFRNEAAAAARINHPNIATIYDYGETENGPFIAMEYIQGKTLEELIGKRDLSFEQALEISEKIAQALAFAHSHGVIHRDIKSANVMLDGSGRVAIMDFGLAKIENATLLTIDGTIMGTPGYMAPEQAQPGLEHPLTYAADTYALGVLMYEMFTNELPFQGQNHMAVLKKVLEEDPIPPMRVNPKIAKDLQVIILKAMEKNPLHRYASADALAEDLRRFREGEPILARSTHFWVKIYRKTHRYRRVFWSFTITVLLALSTTVYLVQRQKSIQVEYKKILGEAHARLMGVQEEREVLLGKLSEDPIFKVLESRDPLMRAQAIIALNQKLRDRELKGTLEKESFDRTLKALDDPHPLVRRHAAILLGILKDSRASGALLERLQDEEPQVRQHVVLALGLLGEVKAVLGITEHLKDANEEVRAKSALALGLLNAKESAGALIGALKDPFPTVRSNAAATLGALKSERAIIPLILLLKDSVPEVRVSAEDALSNFGEEARIPFLIARLKDSEATAENIVQILRGINPEEDQEAFDVVVTLLKHPDSQVRYHAVLVLGLFQNDRAVPFLIRSLRDSDSQVKENARLALIGLTGEDFGFKTKKWKEWWKLNVKNQRSKVKMTN